VWSCSRFPFSSSTQLGGHAGASRRGLGRIEPAETWANGHDAAGRGSMFKRLSRVARRRREFSWCVYFEEKIITFPFLALCSPRRHIFTLFHCTHDLLTFAINTLLISAVFEDDLDDIVVDLSQHHHHSHHADDDAAATAAAPSAFKMTSRSSKVAGKSVPRPRVSSQDSVLSTASQSHPRKAPTPRGSADSVESGGRRGKDRAGPRPTYPLQDISSSSSSISLGKKSGAATTTPRPSTTVPRHSPGTAGRQRRSASANSVVHS
jgi:hypothetical protein